MRAYHLMRRAFADEGVSLDAEGVSCAICYGGSKFQGSLKYVGGTALGEIFNTKQL